MNKNQPIDEYCSMMFLLAALMRSSIPPTIPAAGPSGRSRSVPRAESSAERSSSPWTGADTAVRSASRLRRHHRPAARPRLGEDLPGRNAHLHVALVATRPRCALSAGTESRGPAKQPTCKCEAGDSRRVRHVETENERGEMFDRPRLERFLVAAHTDGVDAVLERIEREVRQFRGNAEPLDDATLMAMRL